MKKVRVVKLVDSKFGGNHPNGVNEGYERIGYEVNPPKIGDRYRLISKYGGGYFLTSTVISLPDENGIFKTNNSTYKLEYLK